METSIVTAVNALTELHPAVYASFSGLSVGVVVKIINKLLDRRREKLDEHLALRKELREELDSVKKEIIHLQDEVDEWKQKYYSQLQLTAELRIAILALTKELKKYNHSGEYPKIIASLGTPEPSEQKN